MPPKSTEFPPRVPDPHSTKRTEHGSSGRRRPRIRRNEERSYLIDVGLEGRGVDRRGHDDDRSADSRRSSPRNRPQK